MLASVLSFSDDLRTNQLQRGREAIMNKAATKKSAIAAAILAVIVGFVFLLAQKTPAQGSELLVFVSDGMKPSVEELTPQIEHLIGHKLTTQFNSSKELKG